MVGYAFWNFAGAASQKLRIKLDESGSWRMVLKLRDVFEDRVFTVSNFLSFSRPFLLPPFLYYCRDYSQYESSRSLLLLLFLIALATLTDFLDGFLARKLHQESKLGQYLDPVSDKIVTIGALTALTLYFSFPVWILIAYILRETAGIWVGYFLFYKRNQQGTPNHWGKWGVGLVSLNVIWYILKPFFARSEAPLFFQHPEIAAYAFLFVLLGGIVAYYRQYRSVIFNKENSPSA